VIVPRGAVISKTFVCSKSDERFYEPSEPGSLGRQRVRLRAPVNRSPLGRCAAQRLRARPPPDPDHREVTFLNGRDGDICIWWTQIFGFTASASGFFKAAVVCPFPASGVCYGSSSVSGFRRSALFAAATAVEIATRIAARSPTPVPAECRRRRAHRHRRIRRQCAGRHPRRSRSAAFAATPTGMFASDAIFSVN